MTAIWQRAQEFQGMTNESLIRQSQYNRGHTMKTSQKKHAGFVTGTVWWSYRELWPPPNHKSSEPRRQRAGRAGGFQVLLAVGAAFVTKEQSVKWQHVRKHRGLDNLPISLCIFKHPPAPSPWILIKTTTLSQNKSPLTSNKWLLEHFSHISVKDGRRELLSGTGPLGLHPD